MQYMGCRVALASFLSTGCGSVTGGHQESQHPSSLSGSRAGDALHLPQPAGGSAAAVKAAAARKTLSYREAFWLATMGGAQTLGLQVHNLLQAVRLLIDQSFLGKTILVPAIHWQRGSWL